MPDSTLSQASFCLKHWPNSWHPVHFSRKLMFVSLKVVKSSGFFAILITYVSYNILYFLQLCDTQSLFGCLIWNEFWLIKLARFWSSAFLELRSVSKKLGQNAAIYTIAFVSLFLKQTLYCSLSDFANEFYSILVCQKW